MGYLDTGRYGPAHKDVATAVAEVFAAQRAAYSRSREDWRRDHPLIPGSTWTPESIGLPPRGSPP